MTIASLDTTPHAVRRMRLRSTLTAIGASALASAALGTELGAQAAPVALASAHARSASAACSLRAAMPRWDVEDGPVSVWIQRRPAALADGQHFAAELDRAVEQGAAAWAGTAPGLRLARVADSTAASVWVVWTRTLDGAATAGHDGATGARTTLAVGPDGRATSALVELATRGGRVPFGPTDVARIAQHEFGHVLGLAHRGEPAAVASAHLAAERPSRGDRATLRALYATGTSDGCETAASRVTGAGAP